jgi:hypothetical protein
MNDIRGALSDLDPENDDHWTAEGLPRVDALGLTGTSRSAITAAAPFFTRSHNNFEIPPAAQPDPEAATDEEDEVGDGTPQDASLLGSGSEFGGSPAFPTSAAEAASIVAASAVPEKAPALLEPGINPKFPRSAAEAAAILAASRAESAAPPEESASSFAAQSVEFGGGGLLLRPASKDDMKEMEQAQVEMAEAEAAVHAAKLRLQDAQTRHQEVYARVRPPATARQNQETIQRYLRQQSAADSPQELSPIDKSFAAQRERTRPAHVPREG